MVYGDKLWFSKLKHCDKCGKVHPHDVRCLQVKGNEYEIEDVEEVVEPSAVDDGLPEVNEEEVSGPEEEAKEEGPEEDLLKEAAEVVETVAAAVSDGVVTKEEKGEILSELSDLPSSPAKKTHVRKVRKATAKKPSADEPL